MAPDNGKVVPDQDDYLPGKSIEFICRKGYVLAFKKAKGKLYYYDPVKEVKDICLKGGKWKYNVTPYCISKLLAPKLN